MEKTTQIDLHGRLVFLIFFLIAGGVLCGYVVHAVLMSYGIVGTPVTALQLGQIAIEVSGERVEQKKIEEALKLTKAVRIPSRVYTGLPMNVTRGYKCLVASFTVYGTKMYTLECGRDGEPEVYRTETAETPTVLAQKIKAYSEWVTVRDAKRS